MAEKDLPRSIFHPLIRDEEVLMDRHRFLQGTSAEIPTLSQNMEKEHCE
jgi:hypothetical protein